MNSRIRNQLNKILSDKTSGSTEILIKLIKWSMNYIDDKEILREMIIDARKELKNFFGVQTFLKELNKIIKGNDKTKISSFLNKESKQIDNRYSNLFKSSLPYLKNYKRIVTLSNSKTVTEILIKLNEQKNIFVTIGESRPQLEGRLMAKELLKHKIKVEIVPDAYLPNSVEQADAVLIGADVILSDKDAVNKIGSRELAIACKYFKKPFYVLATVEKFSRKKKFNPKKRNGKEIWNYEHDHLIKTNYYFEVIEKNLITKLISD